MTQLVTYNAWLTGGASQFVGYTTISWNDGSTARSGQSLTSLTGGIGTQPATDDIVIISFGASSGNNRDLAASGYTEVTDLYANDTTDANLGLFYKVMGGTPDTTFDVSGGSGTAANIVRVMVFRGIDTGSPLDVAVATSTGINSGTSVIPAITPVTQGAIIVGTASAVAGNVLNVSSAMTPPAAYSVFNSGKLSQLCHGMGYGVWDGSGAAGPFTTEGASGNAASWAAAHIALRPA
jgi:hypothetical protein